MEKCPFFKRKVGSYRYSGIKCTSEKYPNNVLGQGSHYGGWSDEQRETKLTTHCFGDYKECSMYKSHMGLHVFNKL